MKHFIPNQQRSSYSRFQKVSKIQQISNHLTTHMRFYKDLSNIDYENLFERFRESKKLPYVIGFENLPNEIQNKVKSLVKHKPPIRKQCFLYSQFISSQIEEVNQIFGFFKIKRFNEIRKDLENLGFKLPKYEKIELYGSEVIFDNNGDCWGIHSWNEYKGVYFDCLNEEIYKKDDWFDFTEYKILNTKRNINYKETLKNEIYTNYSSISGSFNMMIS